MSIKRFRPKKIPVYEIGDIGPGGGIIFMTPSTSGNDTGRYFEFATNARFPVSGFHALPIVNDTLNISSLDLSTSVGSGFFNTLVLNQYYINDTNSILWFVKNYTNNGHNDWYIPSRGEMEKINEASTTLYGELDYVVLNFSGALPIGTYSPNHVHGGVWITSSKIVDPPETPPGDYIQVFIIAPQSTPPDSWGWVDETADCYVLPIRSFYPYGV